MQDQNYQKKYSELSLEEKEMLVDGIVEHLPHEKRAEGITDVIGLAHLYEHEHGGLGMKTLDFLRAYAEKRELSVAVAKLRKHHTYTLATHPSDSKEKRFQRFIRNCHVYCL